MDKRGWRENTTRETGQRIYKRYFVHDVGSIGKIYFQIERQHTGFSVDILLKLTNALDSSCDYLLRGHTEFPYENEIIELIEKFEPNQLGKVYLMLSSLYEIMKKGDL